MDDVEATGSLFEGLMEALAELDGLASIGPEAMLESWRSHYDLDDLRNLQARIPGVISFLQAMDAAISEGHWLRAHHSSERSNRPAA